jgi:hypothetical protein
MSKSPKQKLEIVRIKTFATKIKKSVTFLKRTFLSYFSLAMFVALNETIGCGEAKKQEKSLYLHNKKRLFSFIFSSFIKRQRRTES